MPGRSWTSSGAFMRQVDIALFQARRVWHRLRRECLSRCWGVYARRSDRFWAALRNRHAGETAFVIGNGPSLTMKTLDSLDGQLTFASNRINLAFDKTVWRPRYFAIADWVLYPKIRHELDSVYRRILAGPDLPRRIGKCRVIQYRWLGRTDDEPGGGAPPKFSADAGNGLWSGGTITFDLMQLAAHMGASRIVLVGCDHDYKGEDGVDPKGLASAPGGVNHFDPAYRIKGELVRPACIELMSRAFRHAAAWSKASGVAIVNATPGGALEAFDRVDLHDELAADQSSSGVGGSTGGSGVGASSGGASITVPSADPGSGEAPGAGIG